MLHRIIIRLGSVAVCIPPLSTCPNLQFIHLFLFLKYIFNLLKPASNFTYHHIEHLQILHVDYIPLICAENKTDTFALCSINSFVFVT